MKYRLKYLLIALLAGVAAVVGVMAKDGAFSVQVGADWVGYSIGLPLFSIISLLSLARAIQGEGKKAGESK